MSMEFGVVDSSWHRLDCDAVVLILHQEEESGRLIRRRMNAWMACWRS